MIHSRSKPLTQVILQYDVSKSFIFKCARIGLLRIQRSEDVAVLSFYDEERLQAILKATTLGFTLPEIKLIIDSLSDTSPPSADPPRPD